MGLSLKNVKKIVIYVFRHKNVPNVLMGIICILMKKIITHAIPAYHITVWTARLEITL